MSAPRPKFVPEREPALTKRILLEKWEEYRAIIITKYENEGKVLRAVKREMEEEYGFVAT